MSYAHSAHVRAGHIVPSVAWHVHIAVAHHMVRMVHDCGFGLGRWYHRITLCGVLASDLTSRLGDYSKGRTERERRAGHGVCKMQAKEKGRSKRNTLRALLYFRAE